MKDTKQQILNESIISFKNSGGNSFRVFKVSKEDAWGICNFVVSNEDRLTDFFPLTKNQNLTPELSQHFVDKKTKQFDKREEFLFILRAEESSKVIGLIYIKELDWEKKQGEFAYAIDYNFEGKGITTRVVEELLKYAFEKLGLVILQIIVHKTNVRSIKVAEKNGFRWIKTLEKSFVFNGREPQDMELYKLYKS